MHSGALAEVTMEPECRLAVHQFSAKILDKLIHFQVIKFEGGSFLLWIGGDPPELKALAVAMAGIVSPSGRPAEAAAATVLGRSDDTVQCNFALRLAKKTQKQVLLSYNLSLDDYHLLAAAEKRVLQEIAENPVAFL